MNIPCVKTEGFVPPTRTKPEPVKSSPDRAAGDVYKPSQNEKLMNLIRSEPDARPEAVARATALLSDPSYPSKEILQQVARRVLNQIEPSA